MRSSKSIQTAVLACLFAAAGAAALGQGSPGVPPEVLAYADMVLYNGKIVTADDSFTVAEAVAIRDGKFLAVGARDRIDKLRALMTVLGGKVVHEVAGAF